MDRFPDTSRSRMAGMATYRPHDPLGDGPQWTISSPRGIRRRRVGARSGHAARRALQASWRRIEPSARDTAGWLAHTAPRLVGRLLLRSVPALLRGVWWLVRHAVVGTGWLAARLLPYLAGYTDYHGVLGEAIAEGNARHEKRLREKWRATAWRRIGTTALLLTAAGTGLAMLRARYGWLAVAAVVVALVATLAGIGRVVRGRQARTPEEQAKGEGEPFPIADAHTRGEAAECVTRALKAEDIELRGTDDVARMRWGWQVSVILRRGTPADLLAKLGELETTLDLPQGGLLAAPDRSRRARVVLRLAQRDPFTDIPPAVHRPPATASIVDTHMIGQRMDGTDLGLCLLGVHVVVIGSPGAGKSITLRGMADAVTACRDAIVWDLDPAGAGLDILGEAVARRERDHRGIEDALTDAVSYAQARPRLLSTLDMGDVWQPTRERPAVVVFVDEYTHLTDRAKGLAVELLRIGRKARITLVLASSEATSDAIGAAIAETVAMKILHPCRHSDIRLVLGQGMLAEGWRPDRLNPESGDSPEDAGKCYVYAAGSREPVITKIRLLDRQRAWENGSHRAAHGLPSIDRDTLTTAHTRRDNNSTGNPENTPIVDRQAVLDVLAIFEDRDRLWTEDILLRLSRLDSRYSGWSGEDLAARMPLGVVPVQIKINGVNRRGYHRHVIADAWTAYHHGSRP